MSEAFRKTFVDPLREAVAELEASSPAPGSPEQRFINEMREAFRIYDAREAREQTQAACKQEEKTK